MAIIQATHILVFIRFDINFANNPLSKNSIVCKHIWAEIKFSGVLLLFVDIKIVVS